MVNRRLVAPALAVLVAVMPLAPRAAEPEVPGAAVGFWASQDEAIYTDDVWTALAETGGELYLMLEYTTDFGLSPSRTTGLEIVREANARGVPVNAWFTTPFSMGLFANENNAQIMFDAVKAFDVWVAETGVAIEEIVFDLEFPVGYQPIAEALNGDLSGLLRMAKANVDPEHQCEAFQIYADAIAWAHEHGWRVGASPVPFALDDLFDGSLALQDLLDITALPPVGYDALYLQTYRSYANTGPWYAARYYEEMQDYFGAAGQVSLGDIKLGTPPYRNLGTIVRDVQMLAGMGATAIPMFDLDGTVANFGAEGVRAIVAAGQQPLNQAEIDAMTAQRRAYSDFNRTFFATLDLVATTLATVVGGEPNAYPGGCAID